MKEINNGVNIIDSKVEVSVLITDKATFPLHKYVITLDAVPPGQHPKIIIPSAISLFSPKILVNKKAVIGITTN